MLSQGSSRRIRIPRHTALVRATHWLTVACFIALVVTGAEIVISHPRFYWGEVGNVNVKPFLTLHIPSSRATVPTGYNYVLPDQNGWSRYLHFEMGWVLVLTGLVYGIAGLWTGHFRKNLLPRRDKQSTSLGASSKASEAGPYNVLQKMSYLVVIFVLFPLVIWTGLALSPAFDSAVPAAVNLLGGRQSARTLHFFVSGMLVVFLAVHLFMIARSGFWNRVRSMITGRLSVPEEHP